MVEEPLVIFPQEAGRKLLEKLDAEQLNITAAFWHYVEEEEEWRLVIATPLADSLGPIAMYRKIRAILDEMPEDDREGLSLRDIALVSPHNSTIGWIRFRYGTVTDGPGYRVRRMNMAKDEPFIYRLT